MAEHKHGEMDISVQEKTFEGFMNMTTKAAIGIIVLLVFLALIAV
ncbi:MAG: aa3-type cytochrome c oxidase subunit IV [Yoonia sp.]